MNQQLTIFTDGGSRGNPGSAACAFVVCDEKENVIKQEGKYLGVTTNNMAEYCGVEEALKWLIAQPQKPETVNFKLDWLLVVNQLNGVYKIKNQSLQVKAINVKKLEENINVKVIYRHIKRDDNFLADKFLNEILDNNSC
jgi:ribonuclease HI